MLSKFVSHRDAICFVVFSSGSPHARTTLPCHTAGMPGKAELSEGQGFVIC
jgi:hypothetical protein